MCTSPEFLPDFNEKKHRRKKKNRKPDGQSSVHEEPSSVVLSGIAATEQPSIAIQRTSEEQTIANDLLDIIAMCEGRIHYHQSLLDYFEKAPFTELKTHLFRLYHLRMNASPALLEPQFRQAFILNTKAYIYTYELVKNLLNESSTLTQEHIDKAYTALLYHHLSYEKNEKRHKRIKSNDSDRCFVAELTKKLKPYISKTFSEMLERKYIIFSVMRAGIIAEYGNIAENELEAIKGDLSDLFNSPPYPQEKEGISLLSDSYKSNFLKAFAEYQALAQKLADIFFKEFTTDEWDTENYHANMEKTLEIVMKHQKIIQLLRLKMAPVREAYETLYRDMERSHAVREQFLGINSQFKTLFETNPDLQQNAIVMQWSPKAQAFKTQFQTTMNETGVCSEMDFQILSSVCTAYLEIYKMFDHLKTCEEISATLPSQQKTQALNDDTDQLRQVSNSEVSTSKTVAKPRPPIEKTNDAAKADSSSNQSPLPIKFAPPSSRQQKRAQLSVREIVSSKHTDWEKQSDELRQQNLLERRQKYLAMAEQSRSVNMEMVRRQLRSLTDDEIKRRMERISKASDRITPTILTLFDQLYSDQPFGHQDLEKLVFALAAQGETIRMQGPSGGSSHYAVIIGKKPEYYDPPERSEEAKEGTEKCSTSKGEPTFSGPDFVEKGGRAWRLKDAPFPKETIKSLKTLFENSGYTPTLMAAIAASRVKTREAPPF